MPRLARNVFDDVHHHITQRGNRQEDVFFTDEDRERYLIWLDEYCKKWSVELMSYCPLHAIRRPLGSSNEIKGAGQG
jgi:putative transposase